MWVVKVEWVECLCVTLGIEFVPLKLKGGASVFILIIYSGAVWVVTWGQGHCAPRSGADSPPGLGQQCGGPGCCRGDGHRQICWMLSRLCGLSLVSRWWDAVGARCPGGLDGSSSGCGVNDCVLSGLIHPGMVGMEEQVSWRRRRWSQAEIIFFLGFCSC